MYFDCSIFTGNDYVFIALVKDRALGTVQSAVDLALFFDHSDIPDFAYAVTISRDYFVTSLIEFDRVDGIVVAVEGLNAEVCSNIPE